MSMLVYAKHQVVQEKKLVVDANQAHSSKQLQGLDYFCHRKTQLREQLESMVGLPQRRAFEACCRENTESHTTLCVALPRA